MDNWRLLGEILVYIGVALFFIPVFFSRQYWLKIKLSSVPKSIAGDGKWYSGKTSIFHFPAWMLNRKYKFIIGSSLGFILTGILIGAFCDK